MLGNILRDPKPDEAVTQLVEDFSLLRLACITLMDVLYPGEATPSNVTDLARRLNDSPDAVDRLRDLASRAGVERVVALMLSWYKDAKLEQLRGGF